MRTELKEGLLRGAATVLLLSAVFWSAGQTAILVNEDQAETEDRFCVVIDAGHGGVDPGKVGMNGELEKELNLQIAEKLKLFLEASDVEVVDPENHRTSRANDSYYLLKKTGRPLVIVECGFLSNPEEAARLSDDYYQEKLAWHIHMALMQYLNHSHSSV